jgi:hypothetical protein
MSYLNSPFLIKVNFIMAHPTNKPRKKKVIDKAQIGINSFCSKGQKLRYVICKFDIVKIEKNIINGSVKINEKTFVKFLIII